MYELFDDALQFGTGSAWGVGTVPFANEILRIISGGGRTLIQRIRERIQQVDLPDSCVRGLERKCEKVHAEQENDFLIECSNYCLTGGFCGSTVHTVFFVADPKFLEIQTTSGETIPTFTHCTGTCTIIFSCACDGEDLFG